MNHKYVCTALLPDGTEVGEIFETKSSRPSKVVKQIDEAFLKKYGVKLTSLLYPDIRKINKNFKLKSK
jgi:hypothetical protein